MNANELIWYPAEVNTSIRPGWFYHTSEDEKVKSLEELLIVYYGSVGGNANFLLNIPPDQRGLIHKNDATRLKEFGQAIKEIFQENLAQGSVLNASDTMSNKYDVRNILDGDINTYWCTKEGTEEAIIELEFDGVKKFNKVVIMEHIQLGQRVENFNLKYWKDDHWEEFYEGTIIGYKRICCFDTIETNRLRFTITGSRCYPMISNLVFIRDINL